MFSAAPKVEHLRAKRHVVRKPSDSSLYRVVMLMSESELKERESRIHLDPSLNADEKFQYIAKLNDSMKMLALDGQNRVVLPGECVAHIGVLENRDVKFVCTNTAIQVWNPAHFASYVGDDDPGAFDHVLNHILL